MNCNYWVGAFCIAIILIGIGTVQSLSSQTRCGSDDCSSIPWIGPFTASANYSNLAVFLGMLYCTTGPEAYSQNICNNNPCLTPWTGPFHVQSAYYHDCFMEYDYEYHLSRIEWQLPVFKNSLALSPAAPAMGDRYNYGAYGESQRNNSGTPARAEYIPRNQAPEAPAPAHHNRVHRRQR